MLGTVIVILIPFSQSRLPYLVMITAPMPAVTPIDHIIIANTINSVPSVSLIEVGAILNTDINIQLK